MLDFVVCNYLKVIRKWLGDDFAVTKVITQLFLGLQDIVYQGLEHHIEDYRAVVVASKDTVAEPELVGLPPLGYDPALELGVEVHDVLDLPPGDVVVLEAVLDEPVGHGPVGVGEVIPGDVEGPALLLGVLNDLLEHPAVSASVHPYLANNFNFISHCSC